jgi:hypothetical protein
MSEVYKCPICGGEVKPSGFNGELFCWGKCYTYGLARKYLEYAAELQAENERLREALVEDIAKLEAENAKIRDALEGLLGHYYDVPNCWCECCEAIRKANATLNTAKGE